jgi:hypothetical protein
MSQPDRLYFVGVNIIAGRRSAKKRYFVLLVTSFLKRNTQKKYKLRIQNRVPTNDKSDQAKSVTAALYPKLHVSWSRANQSVTLVAIEKRIILSSVRFLNRTKKPSDNETAAMHTWEKKTTST